jgi:Family of unknown function (DUF6459)
MPTTRPTMLGDLRLPVPQAAVLTRGHEPPDPHGTGTGPRINISPECPPWGSEWPNVPGRCRPLPDPVAVRLCRIPDPAPPYDGEVSQGCGLIAAARHGEPASVTAKQAGRPASRAGSAPATPPGWPSRFAQVLAETLAGSRPPGQIAPWTTEVARLHIQRLGPQLTSVQQPRVRRVVTFQPAPDVMEMTVVVGFGTRVRALAVRLERANLHPVAYGRHPRAPGWLCTAVEAA